MTKYDELKEKIEKACEAEGVSADEIFCIPVCSAADQIAQVEAYLGLKLPDSYKWFLESYGSGGMDTYDFFGIESQRKEISLHTVVYATESYRKRGLDRSLVVIQDLGEYVRCIDTGKRDAQNESPVVNWSCHDNDGIVVESDSFLDYFLGIIEDYI